MYEEESENGSETVSEPQKTEPMQYSEVKKEISESLRCKEEQDKTGCSMIKNKQMKRKELRKAVIWSELLAKPVSLRDE